MRLLSLFLAGFVLAGCASAPVGGDADASQTDTSRALASAKIHTELAGMYYERAQYGIALEELSIALNKESGYAPAYNVRGLVHMALLEDEEAESDFKRSLDLDENNSAARNNYGWFLCQRGRERESVKQFMAAVKNPLYATPEKAFLNAGLCSKKAGMMVEAEAYLRRALIMQPKMPEALLGMAELNYAQADFMGAKTYFQRFSQLVPELTAANLMLAIRIERKVGDRNSEASYKMQLRKRFPDSRETKIMLSGE
jgi:type IV pilus assembly protein PilF